jgi:hypothetical protein
MANAATAELSACVDSIETGSKVKSETDRGMRGPIYTPGPFQNPRILKCKSHAKTGSVCAEGRILNIIGQIFTELSVIR